MTIVEHIEFSLDQKHLNDFLRLSFLILLLPLED